MKIFDRVVQSNTEPSIHSLWIKGNDILYFGKNGWTGLDFSKNTELKNMLEQEIKDRENSDQEIKDTYLPLTGGTLKKGSGLGSGWADNSAILNIEGTTQATKFVAKSSLALGFPASYYMGEYGSYGINLTWNNAGVNISQFGINKWPDADSDCYIPVVNEKKDHTLIGQPLLINGIPSVRRLDTSVIPLDKNYTIELAPLENGLVPAAYLPSYVDDVLEFTSIDSFPETGESGKIYVDTITNLTYRWSGTQYIEVSKSIGLGTSAADAYPGNLGQQNADNIAALQGDVTDINQTINSLGDTYLPLSGGTLTGRLQADGGILIGNALLTSSTFRLIGTPVTIFNGNTDWGLQVSGSTTAYGTPSINMYYNKIVITDNDIDEKYDNLTIDENGITIKDKTTNDLLNAAGSTTSISDITTQIQAAIVDSAPETLDTLNELAAALNDDPNFATTITNLIGTKVDNSKWETIANTNIVTAIDDFSYAEDSILLNLKFILKNDSGSFNAESQTAKTINAATTTTAGVLTAKDFKKLSNIGLGEKGGINRITFDAYQNDYAIFEIKTEITEGDGLEQTTLVFGIGDNSYVGTGSDSIEFRARNWKQEGSLDYVTARFTNILESRNPTTNQLERVANISEIPTPTVNAASGTKTIWTGTQSEYEAIDTKDANTLYFITEG